MKLFRVSKYVKLQIHLVLNILATSRQSEMRKSLANDGRGAVASLRDYNTVAHRRPLSWESFSIDWYIRNMHTMVIREVQQKAKEKRRGEG